MSNRTTTPTTTKGRPPAPRPAPAPPGPGANARSPPPPRPSASASDSTRWTDRKRDSLDFYDISVAAIRDAIGIAFDARWDGGVRGGTAHARVIR